MCSFITPSTEQKTTPTLQIPKIPESASFSTTFPREFINEDMITILRSTENSRNPSPMRSESWEFIVAKIFCGSKKSPIPSASDERSSASILSGSNSWLFCGSLSLASNSSSGKVISSSPCTDNEKKLNNKLTVSAKKDILYLKIMTSSFIFL